MIDKQAEQECNNGSHDGNDLESIIDFALVLGINNPHLFIIEC